MFVVFSYHDIASDMTPASPNVFENQLQAV